jgi:hypothetical protein
MANLADCTVKALRIDWAQGAVLGRSAGSRLRDRNLGALVEAIRAELCMGNGTRMLVRYQRRLKCWPVIG